MANKQMKTIQFPNSPDIYEIVDETARNRVVANSSDPATENLTTIKIGETTYRMPAESGVPAKGLKTINSEPITGEGNFNLAETIPAGLTRVINLLEDQKGKWQPKWFPGIDGSAQDFILDPTLNCYKTIVPSDYGQTIWSYCNMPIVKVITTAGTNTEVAAIQSNFYFRHLWFFNSKGKVLFCCGSGAGDGMPPECPFFSGGFDINAISKFLKAFSDIETYPTINDDYPHLRDTIQTGTYGPGTFNFQLNINTVAEFNKLYLFYKGGLTSKLAEYIPGETIFIAANPSMPTERPEELSLQQSWADEGMNCLTIMQEQILDSYQLPGFALNPEEAKLHYKSPMVNEIFNELGDFKDGMALENFKKEHIRTKIIYNEELVENFYPTSAHDYYVTSSTYVSGDFSNPAYYNITKYAGYKITLPIPLIVDDNHYMEVPSNMRHFSILNEHGKGIYYDQNQKNIKFNLNWFKEHKVPVDQAKYLLVSNTGTNATNFRAEQIEDKIVYSYEMPNLRLSPSQLPSSMAANKVTLNNVDRIVSIGDSYTESHFTIKDKAWMSKVSLLTEYNCDNFAVSGDTYRGQLNKIRTGYNRYTNGKSGITWEDLNPTHAILISGTNDTKYMDAQQYLYDLEACLEVTKNLGAIPIVATEYHVSGKDYLPTAFDFYAKKHGGYFLDLMGRDYVLRGKDYKPFWGGSHPGTRPNHLFSDGVTKFINEELPRPYSAIKIFRPRDLTKVDNLDNFIFATKEERAEKFKEISIGHSCLDESKYYDNCTNKGQHAVESEYCRLMAHLPVQFSKMCLIDVILPSTVQDLNSVKLITNKLTGVDCYVKDTLAEPYPSPEFCRRFDINMLPAETQVKVGDVYTSSKGGDAKYKVKEIFEGEVESDQGFVTGTILICSGNKTTGAYNDTVLTKVSGAGLVTLNCKYESVGLSSNYPVGKADNGHYIKLETFGEVSGQVLKRAVQVDKITFLLVSQGDFKLTTTEVEFDGPITKQRDTIKYRNNLFPVNTTYTSIFDSKFDDASIGNWKISGNEVCKLVPIIPEDGVMPLGITKVTVLKPSDGVLTHAFTPEVDNTRVGTFHCKVKVWARRFPPIFNEATMKYPEEAPITEDSFDWAKLSIRLFDDNSIVKSTTGAVKMEKLVGLHWDEIEFDLTLPPVPPTTSVSWHIGIEAIDKEIQIARIDIQK